MKIPNNFKLFNHKITVKNYDHLIRDTTHCGESRYNWKEIVLDNNGLRTFKEQTFLHEVVHMILDHMNEGQLSQDEKFVNTFSELLYQFLETSEYKKGKDAI